jgi:type II pantothenate kinase
VDVGASLTKLAVRRRNGDLDFRLIPSHAIERAAREVESLGPECLGLTGGGAPGLSRLLGLDTAPVNEFDALREGARLLLERQGEAPAERDLLVSLGTGTSVLLVDGEGTTRVGGTGLGGGTLLGLAAGLLGTTDFHDVVKLASEGDRRRVDLLVRDVDPHGVIPLARDLNASSFGKLARHGAGDADRRDVAHALMGLLGENVAIICASCAALTGARRIVFTGSTLRGNGALRNILVGAGASLSRPVLFLQDGEFAGAVGALELCAKDE